MVKKAFEENDDLLKICIEGILFISEAPVSTVSVA